MATKINEDIYDPFPPLTLSDGGGISDGGADGRQLTELIVSYVLCCSWVQDACGCVEQGFPAPRPRTDTGPWPVKNWAAQQEVSGRRTSEASSVFIAAPHHSHYPLSSVSCQISGSIRFSSEREPYCELRMRGI